MMECLLVAFLFLNGLLSADSNTDMKSNDILQISSLTSSGKISNVLRDILNQESLVRFSMTQRIQGLVMDALDNKNNSLILNMKLNDLNSKLQSIAKEDQAIKTENAQLKEELNTIKEAIKYDKNRQNQRLQRNLSNVTSELQFIAAENQVIKKENAQIKQELNTVKQEIKYGDNHTMQQSESLKRNLSDVITELQSIAAENRVMREENAQLKQDLNTVKEAMKHDKNNVMQQSESLMRSVSHVTSELQSIAAENQKMMEENTQLKQEISTVKQKIRNDKNFFTWQIQNLKRTEISALAARMDNENSTLQQELNNLKVMSVNNEQNIQNLNTSIRKINNDFKLQIQMINDSLQEHDSQLLNISTQLSSVNSKHLLHNSCMEILQSDLDVKGKDGVHSINVDGQEKKVYCDMTTDGGGWTVIQKREDGSTDFYRNWTDYKKGFGDPSKNYWIGNDVIHHLTQKPQELRVDLLSFAGEKAYAKYSEFRVGNETSKYELTARGYSGTAGDSLAIHNGHKFTTRDQDNDVSSYRNCAVSLQGAWWYRNCANSNLNGLYAGSALSGYQYTVWYHWKSWKALKWTKMMTRPKS